MHAHTHKHEARVFFPSLFLAVVIVVDVVVVVVVVERTR